ncbi:hypothetical protein, partial [uncultured Reyranella sp.]|uniref:hypothetical protein n=1 Tax=uncultured Reyranella sp. TaxID=735512 RepID=UPI00259C699E
HCDASTRNRLKGKRHGGQFFMTERGQFRMSLDRAVCVDNPREPYLLPPAVKPSRNWVWPSA